MKRSMWLSLVLVAMCYNTTNVWAACPDSPETEICNDSIDNDCDGKIDCVDVDCDCDPICKAEKAKRIEIERLRARASAAEQKAGRALAERDEALAKAEDANRATATAMVKIQELDKTGAVSAATGANVIALRALDVAQGVVLGKEAGKTDAGNVTVLARALDSDKDTATVDLSVVGGVIQLKTGNAAQPRTPFVVPAFNRGPAWPWWMAAPIGVGAGLGAWGIEYARCASKNEQAIVASSLAVTGAVFSLTASILTRRHH